MTVTILTAEIDRIGAGLPIIYLVLFLGASALMIWRTEALMGRLARQAITKRDKVAAFGTGQLGRDLFS